MFETLAVAALTHPQIDPVLVQIGPIAIRWYALAYVAGILLGWWYAVRIVKTERLWDGAPFQGKPPFTPADADDFILWVTLGIILGGRIGYLLFYGFVYEPQRYADPAQWIRIWEGGMSFHGGLIGVIVATVIFALLRGIDMVRMGDVIAQVVPIGLFFGRMGNFINGELYGKPADVPWAMIFPHVDQIPRHPSQLYEAALEGVAIFVILRVLVFRFRWHERPGLVVASFLVLYGVFRAFCEVFRASDQLVDPGAGISMGMALSVPMWAAAAFFLWWAFRKPLAR